MSDVIRVTSAQALLFFFNRKPALQTRGLQFESRHLMGQEGSNERHYWLILHEEKW